MARNVNVVAITGNLTKDPELRSFASGTSVCSLRIAVNESVKEDGDWTERANYFDVDVWGAQGENCVKWLSKGRPVAIEGRLRWREWETQDGHKRQAVSITANTVQFLGGKEDGGGGGSSRSTRESDVPADVPSGGADPPPASDTDDSIPF